MEYSENERAAQLGLLGRRSAYLPNKMGAFALPRLLRYIFRTGFGDEMLDIDMSSSHYCSALELANEWGVQVPLIRSIVADRGRFVDQFMRPTMRYASDAEIKTIMLATAFGQRVAPGHPAELVALAREFDALHHETGRRFPGMIEALTLSLHRNSMCRVGGM